MQLKANIMTIKDVAKKCGVSISTVSRAINNHPEINDSTRQAILQEIKRLGYVPNSNARNLNLKCRANDAIAVIIKGISNPFFTPMIKCFESEINKRGYSFLLYKAEEAEDEVSVAVKLIAHEKLKGIIFLGGFIVHDKRELERLKVPFVMSTIINKDMAVKNSVYIGVDDVVESERITDYLISLGHRDILLLGGRSSDMSISMLRIEGYKRALKKNGLSEHELIITSDTHNTPYTYIYGYEMAEKILKLKLSFTAVYCISDTIAIGFMKRFRENGLLAPRDYSIVGFDGLEINEYLSPCITTMSQPVIEMSKRACEELFNMIDKKPYEKLITFKGSLRLGDTTRAVN